MMYPSSEIAKLSQKDSVSCYSNLLVSYYRNKKMDTVMLVKSTVPNGYQFAGNLSNYKEGIIIMDLHMTI